MYFMDAPFCSSSFDSGFRSASARARAFILRLRRATLRMNGSRTGSLESHGENRGQVRRDALPVVAAVVRDPQPAGGRADRQALPARVDVETVAIHEVVRRSFRKAASQNLVAPAPVARARHREL